MRETERETDRDTDRERHTQRDRQTDRQTDRQADRDRSVEIANKARKLLIADALSSGLENHIIIQIQTQKGTNERLFILTRTHSMQIFGEIPFIKPQNDT